MFTFLRNFKNLKQLLFCITLANIATTQILKGAMPDIPKNPVSLLAKIQTEAEEGNANSQYLVGLLFLSGEGFPKNMERALYWLELSALQGNQLAQNIVGMIYDPTWFFFKGKKGIPLAIKFYQSSAAQSNQSAIHNLSVMRKLGYLSETELVTPSPNGMLSSVLQRAIPLEPTALRATGSPSSLEAQPGTEFLEGRESANSLYTKYASSVAEIIGDEQYGSGSIVGELQVSKSGSAIFYNNKPEGSLVEFANKIESSEKKFLVISTNSHVVENNSTLEIGLGSDFQGSSLEKTKAEGICFSNTSEEDLAFVLVPETETLKKLNLRKFNIPQISIVPPGSRVFTFANPRQLSRTISQGIVSANRPEGIQFDASISTGSSGGALLNEKGDLVGTIVGYVGTSSDQNLNFAIPSSKLLQMLEGNNLSCEWITKNN